MPDLPKYSRFKLTEPVVHKGQQTVPLAVLPDFLTRELYDNEIDYFEVTPDNEYRIDRIADQLYGSPDLEWVLLYYNNAYNTSTWPKSGDIIKYPTRSIVISELS